MKIINNVLVLCKGEKPVPVAIVDDNNEVVVVQQIKVSCDKGKGAYIDRAIRSIESHIKSLFR